MNISCCVVRSFVIVVCFQAFFLSVLLCKSNSSKAKFNSCGRVSFSQFHVYHSILDIFPELFLDKVYSVQLPFAYGCI